MDVYLSSPLLFLSYSIVSWIARMVFILMSSANQLVEDEEKGRPQNNNGTGTSCRPYAKDIILCD